MILVGVVKDRRIEGRLTASDSMVFHPADILHNRRQREVVVVKRGKIFADESMTQEAIFCDSVLRTHLKKCGFSFSQHNTLHSRLSMSDSNYYYN